MNEKEDQGGTEGNAKNDQRTAQVVHHIGIDQHHSGQSQHEHAADQLEDASLLFFQPAGAHRKHGDKEDTHLIQLVDQQIDQQQQDKR